MGYYCPNPIFETTHEFRCVRRDNDMVLVCDYVQRVEECNFYTIYEPAANGMHDRWQMCLDCDNLGDLSDVSCSQPRPCAYCDMAG
jgi:hypothetical protein